MSPHALLVLEDGRHFRGTSFGATGETVGEAVFTTAMTGYQEILTDPSFHRQIVVATMPHIGMAGWVDGDDESRQIWAAGYVVREVSRLASNWRASRSLPEVMAEQGIIGISGVDTRALTRHLRAHAAMRMAISTTETDPKALQERLAAAAPLPGHSLVTEVTCQAPYTIEPTGEHRLTVAALDLGIKSMTPYRLAERGVRTVILLATSSFADLMAVQPDGVFFSNGPGDPATATAQTEVLAQVLDAGIPYFGICLGHQMFGRALGLRTYRLANGHRGTNQPVQHRRTGAVEITTHNHGFAVEAPLDAATSTPYGQVSVSHVNLNDNVVEGLELHREGTLAAFSVQYHPEAAAGPHDSAYVFDRFVDLMLQKKDT